MKKRRGPPWTRRYAAALAACPKCGAPPEEPCVRKNSQPRMSVHRERMKSSSEQAGSCSDWIEWRGGQCPLPAGTLFEYRLRGGGPSGPLRTPTAWRWEHDGGEYDIVAYRALNDEQTAPATKENAGE